MNEVTLQRHPETGEIVPEIWKSILHYEGAYDVSNYGRVKSLARTVIGQSGGLRKINELIRKESKHPEGYLIVRLCRNGVCKTYKIHGLVAAAFAENKNKLPQVNHKDSVKNNNFYHYSPIRSRFRMASS